MEIIQTEKKFKPVTLGVCKSVWFHICCLNCVFRIFFTFKSKNKTLIHSSVLSKQSDSAGAK